MGKLSRMRRLGGRKKKPKDGGQQGADQLSVVRGDCVLSSGWQLSGSPSARLLSREGSSKAARRVARCSQSSAPVDDELHELIPVRPSGEQTA
eukprot:scaffold10530_cov30-Tisochrysis_lutea.AAC.1